MSISGLGGINSFGLTLNQFDNMKKLGVFVAACVIAGGLSAQDNRASVGLEVALPMGDWADFVGVGFGATLGYEIPMGDNIGLIANAGFISFAGKDLEVNTGLGTVTVEGKSSSAIPIQVGGKYYFTDQQEGAYLGLLTGMHLFSSDGNSDSNFGVAPLLGFMVTENIDVAVRYQMLFAKQETVVVTGTSVTTEEETVTNSYLGLRLAYNF